MATCMVCFDKFDDGDHHALALHCGHIIGKSCLDQYEKISKQAPSEAELYRGVRVQFKCPNCKGPIGRNYEPRKLFLTYDDTDSPSLGSGSGTGAGSGDNALRQKAQELSEKVMRLNQQCEELKSSAAKAEKTSASEKRALEKSVRDQGQRIQSLVETGELLQERVKELKAVVEKQQSLLDSKSAQLADYEREEVAMEYMAGKLSLEQMKGEFKEQGKARAKQRRKEMGARYDTEYELSLTVSELTTMLAAVEGKNKELEEKLKTAQTDKQEKILQLSKEVHKLKNVQFDNIKLMQTNKKLTATVEALHASKASSSLKEREGREVGGIEASLRRAPGAETRLGATGASAAANRSTAGPPSYPRVSIFSASSSAFAPPAPSSVLGGPGASLASSKGTALNRSFGLPSFSAQAEALLQPAASRPMGIVPSDNEESGDEQDGAPKEEEEEGEGSEQGGAGEELSGRFAAASTAASRKRFRVVTDENEDDEGQHGTHGVEGPEQDMPPLHQPAGGTGQTQAAGKAVARQENPQAQTKRGYENMFEKLRAEDKRKATPQDPFSQHALTRSLLSTAPVHGGDRGSNPVFEASKRRRVDGGTALQADKDVLDLFSEDNEEGAPSASASAPVPAPPQVPVHGQGQAGSTRPGTGVSGATKTKTGAHFLNSYFRPLSASEMNQRSSGSSVGVSSKEPAARVDGGKDTGTEQEGHEEEIEVLD